MSRAMQAGRQAGKRPSGSGRIPSALNATPEVKGIAFGAFGGIGSSVNVLIDGFTHEGALKNPDRLGQSNCKAAYGATLWWLKRRWSRLAVIKAVGSRHDALRYAGDSAQRQTASQHARAQDRGDWRCDGTFREHARERFSQGGKPASAPNEMATSVDHLCPLRHNKLGSLASCFECC